MKTSSIIEPFTDLGNAERLIKAHGCDIRYCPERRSWLIWDGTRWKWDDSLYIYKLAKNVIRDIQEINTGNEKVDESIRKWGFKSESRSRIESMVSISRYIDDIIVHPSDLDKDPSLLNCNNGTLDLNSGLLLNHCRNDYITKTVGFDYKENSKSHVFDSFIKKIIPDNDLRLYLQKVFGYSLYGKATVKSFWFLFGPADSGKSTFLEVILLVFGDYGVSSQFSTWIYKQNRGDNRGDIVDLMGARLVVSSEARRGVAFDEEVIKRVTGGDRLKFCKKFENEVEFYATFKLFFAANDAPIIRDDDSGIWSRVNRVPFKNSIPRDDIVTDIKSQLSTVENKQAALCWLLEGYRLWKKDGIGECNLVAESNKEYIREMDRTKTFFDECLEFRKDYWADTYRIWNCYCNYCKEEGISGVSKKELVTRLKKEKGCADEKKNGKRGWLGVDIAEERLNGPIINKMEF